MLVASIYSITSTDNWYSTHDTRTTIFFKCTEHISFQYANYTNWLLSLYSENSIFFGIFTAVAYAQMATSDALGYSSIRFDVRFDVFFHGTMITSQASQTVLYRVRVSSSFFIKTNLFNYGTRKIHHVSHHHPDSAFGAAKNHFIDLPNKNMLPALNVPSQIKWCTHFINCKIAAVV